MAAVTFAVALATAVADAFVVTVADAFAVTVAVAVAAAAVVATVAGTGAVVTFAGDGVAAGAVFAVAAVVTGVVRGVAFAGREVVLDSNLNPGIMPERDAPTSARTRTAATANRTHFRRGRRLFFGAGAAFPPAGLADPAPGTCGGGRVFSPGAAGTGVAGPAPRRCAPQESQ